MTTISKQFIIDYLQDYYKTNNDIPKSNNTTYPFGRRRVERLFGSWNNALTESDIPLRRNKPVMVSCKYCEKEFSKPVKEMKRSKNNFCSSSCNAKFNNARRTISKATREKIKEKMKTHVFNKTCKRCNNEFTACYRFTLYCSLKCKLKKRECVICSKPIYTEEGRKIKTCSDKCHSALLSIKCSNQWQSGTI